MGSLRARIAAAAIVCAMASTASAQPTDPYGPSDPTSGRGPKTEDRSPSSPRDTSTALRDANAAAAAGDWAVVAQLVDPLFSRQLPKTELAEAHRLAGLAAFAQQRATDAEAHFVAYLKTDLDATLDPAVYPPDVVTFFLDVRKRHEAELRALRPTTKRHMVLNVLPTVGQFQNGERTKGIVLGAMMGTFLVANVTSYLILDSWCSKTSLNGHDGATCDDSSNHVKGAQRLQALNTASGIALIATYVFGVYDGVTHYRRRTHEIAVQPYVTTPIGGGSVLGLTGSF